MGGSGRDGDALDHWLQGEGLAALEGILGGTQDIVGVIDAELRVRYLNWATPGLVPADLMGTNVLDMIPPDYHDLAHDVFVRTLRTGVADSFETHYRAEHGVLVWDVRVGPIHHEGKVIGLVTINTNVTEERRANVDRDRFFALSLDMLAVFTEEGRFKRVNPAFAEILGYDAAALTGKPFLEFVHPEDQVRTMAAFSAGRRALSESFENRYRRGDGTYCVLSWRGVMDPLTGDGYAVARDITAQREAEDRLHHAQKMEAVGLLAGGIAHDFNNLMQAVLGNVELALLQLPKSSKVVEQLHEIEGAGRRAAELTKQLLMFSRRQPLHPALLDLNDLVQRLMKILRRLLPENIAIEVRAAHPLASLSADATQLEQVIINLCVNARDAMEHGGSLTIETDEVLLEEHDCEASPWAEPGSFVRLRVSDTGTGMSAEVRERVFDPFFTTKSQQRGTGLGLATVYGIVQQHGGLVRVSSELGRGATFEVYLPADERSAQRKDSQRPGDGAFQGGGETILIAEDEELVRVPVVRLLESAGYRTLAAVHGLDAIRLLNEHPEVELAVLDVVMPELGGPEAWARMRTTRPDLRVIFTSGYADDRCRKLLPEGALVLEKPFRTRELLRAVKNRLAGIA